MKTKRFIIFLMLTVVPLAFGRVVCSADVLRHGAEINSLSQLENANIGVPTGSIQAIQAEEHFPKAKLFYFSQNADMISALESGKIDAYVDAEASAYYMTGSNPKLRILDEHIADVMQVCAVFAKTDKGNKLCRDFNDFLKTLKASGEYDEIRDRWLSGNVSGQYVDDAGNLPAVNGVLVVAADPTMVPFAFIKDNKLVGLDVDTTIRFCKEYGYGLKFMTMDFAGILPAIVTGKCDFAGGGVVYTDERAESVLFSDPTFEGSSVVVVLNKTRSSSTLLESFEKTFIREDRWRLFTDGIITTLVITLLAVLSGTIIGFLAFMACRGGNKPVNTITDVCRYLINGMPMVVLLMILYYIIFGNTGISGIAVAIAGFSLTFGSAVFGMLKSGVGGIDKGQYEAAYALGHSDNQTFFRVILPQALPQIMPSFQEEVVSLIKATSIVGYIAVQDLTKAGDIVRSRTYEAFFPLIAVAVIYFLLESLMILIVSNIRIATDPRKLSRKDIMKGVRVSDKD